MTHALGMTARVPRAACLAVVVVLQLIGELCDDTFVSTALAAARDAGDDVQAMRQRVRVRAGPLCAGGQGQQTLARARSCAYRCLPGPCLRPLCAAGPTRPDNGEPSGYCATRLPA